MLNIGKLEIVTAGDILKEEFLTPMGITPYRLAMEIKVSNTLISKIIKGERSITADMALRLSKFFGTTPEFWTNLQNSQDLKIAKERQKEEGLKIKMFNLMLPEKNKSTLKHA